MLRAVIFIDGQNLWYKLNEIGLQEKDIDWSQLFSDLVPDNYRLIRAYWYQASRIAQWNWNAKHHPKLRPVEMSVEDFKTNAKAFYRDEKDRLERLHEKVYGRIEENFPAVEFRYVGVLKVNPVHVEPYKNGGHRIGKRVGEKGVDVAMAVDMVRHLPNYDLAIIVSGDYDFLPAIQAVKDQLRGVHIVSVMKGTPPKHQGQARRLRGLCDAQIQVYESDLKTRYNTVYS